MKLPRPALFFPSLFVLSSLAVAQIPPGHAVVAWKAGGTAPGGLMLVDPAGNPAPMPGLDASTIGTGQFDGATSVLVTDDGTVFAGLGVDNTGGGGPLPLTIRRITWNGTTANDQPFVSLQLVAPNDIWQVVDMKERSDGSLLVAASQVVLGPNAIATPAAFVVDRNGIVTNLPVAGMSGGVLMAIADFGDRFAVAIDESFFVRNIELQSLAFDGMSAPFTISLLVGAGSFGGFERDLDGELVFGASFRNATSTMHRVAHAPNAVPVAIPGGPASISLGEVNPASGVMSTFTFAGALNRSDSVLGGTQQWAASVVSDVIAISVRDNAAGFALQIGSPQALLGSQGGVPALGNAGFTLRASEPSGQGSLGIVLAGFGRGNVATPFGTLLIDPTAVLSVGVVVMLPGQFGTFPLPIPGSASLAGTRFVFQDLVLPPSPASAALLSNGLDLTLQ